MLRLDASAPPLWRDDGEVQFGAPPVAHVRPTAEWHEPAITALESGTTRAELRGLSRLHGGTDADADAFLHRVRPALSPAHRQPPIVLQVADDLPARAVQAVLAGLPRRTAVHAWAGTATEAVRTGARVVLLGAHRVDPRRATTLLGADVTHVPLVLDAATAVIGPVIVPGRTACLSCLDATARKSDPSWPLVAAQLLARPRPDIDTAFAAEAARAARHLLSEPVADRSRSLRLRVDAFPRLWEEHRPSEDCRCRSLEESETESARFALARATS